MSECKWVRLLALLTLLIATCTSGAMAQITATQVMTYSGPNISMDQGTDVVVDATGNIYVAGYSANSFESADYDALVLKYDTGGNLVWSSVRDGNSRTDDIPCGLRTDQFGNVSVTGWSGNASQEAFGGEILTIQYDAAGTLLWETTYQGMGPEIRATDLDVDDFGNVYLTGGAGDPGMSQYLTLVYAPDGSLVQELIDPGVGMLNSAAAIDVTPMGEIFLTGSSEMIPEIQITGQ